VGPESDDRRFFGRKRSGGRRRVSADRARIRRGGFDPDPVKRLWRVWVSAGLRPRTCGAGSFRRVPRSAPVHVPRPDRSDCLGRGAHDRGDFGTRHPLTLMDSLRRPVPTATQSSQPLILLTSGSVTHRTLVTSSSPSRSRKRLNQRLMTYRRPARPLRRSRFPSKEVGRSVTTRSSGSSSLDTWGYMRISSRIPTSIC